MKKQSNKFVSIGVHLSRPVGIRGFPVLHSARCEGGCGQSVPVFGLSCVPYHFALNHFASRIAFPLFRGKRARGATPEGAK
jgi:hypothetical protein